VILQKLQRSIKAIRELAVLSRDILTTFWFWVPPLFATYIFAQLWLIFFVHPLTLVVLPSILAVYAMVQEDKRVKAMYGLGSIKKKGASDPFGAAPQELEGFKWDVQKALAKYEEALKGESEENKADTS
jgi:hypothetical protein